ncbi:MAG: hypothetical protein ACTS3T_03035 [Almyronema sp.]
MYGVRFGAQTGYCLLDIDVTSPYHPKQDPLAIARLVDALEPLGLVNYVACTSSYSGGLHLYFPLATAQKSWQLAAAVTTLLSNAGFPPRLGQLEVFPNARLYVADGLPKLFNGHRLPLQAGSYLLNSHFEPIWTSQLAFVRQWHYCQQRNGVTQRTISQILKQAQRRCYRISGRADQFLNDLNAEIELGWTGTGQTNRLLGRITMRCYIFHHILQGGKPLQGQSLVAQIVAVAKALPGYRRWCQHQHEIEQRAAEWANCIENSHYFPYGLQQGKYKAKIQLETAEPVVGLTWNQQQTQNVRQKIQAAIDQLLSERALAEKATARFQQLISYGIGGSSLYRHKDLWHPQFWHPPQTPPATKTDLSLVSAEGAANDLSPISLFPLTGRNPSSANDDSDRLPAKQSPLGCNDRPAAKLKPGATPIQTAAQLKQLLHNLQQQAQTRHQQGQILGQQQLMQKTTQHEAQWAARMQIYLQSNDPILQAEALDWAIASTARLQQALSQLQAKGGATQSDQRLQQLAEIFVELLRLNWTPAQIQTALRQQWGKSAIAQLSTAARQAWLHWLQQQTGLP